MSLPLYPIWIVDLAGSALMIAFSFLSVRVALRLRRVDPHNVVWIYLLWVCGVLAAFAVSRSVGHIAKRVLLTAGYDEAWGLLRPYTGAVNTLTFVAVASVTLFFGRIWKIYQQILRDKQALQEAHEGLLYMNRNLENLVAERTEELSRSERKYRRIFEGSRDMIAVVREDGGVVDLNAAGVDMLGIGEDGRPLEEVEFGMFFGDRGDWERLRQAFILQGYVADEEVPLKRLDGAAFNGLISGRMEGGEDGGACIYHLLVKDISRRKTMEQQLLQADKLASIGQLAAGIAHEINNPLGIILGYTQLLIREEPEGSQRLEDLRIIEKHTRNCKTIVENLLSFSRSARTRKAVSHLHKAIEEVVSVVRHHFELEGIRIETSFDPRTPPLILDAAKIKQVFMNLVMNARQAIERKGTISIATRYERDPERVVVDVEDTGAGIDPRHLSRIFDPFFTTKPTGEGTGLGLSVSYGIVRDHGGEFYVDNRPQGGAVFTMVLPVNRQDEAGEAGA